MSAEFLTLAALCRAGDHIVSSAQLYGGTRTLLEGTLAASASRTTFVAVVSDPTTFAAAVTPRTKAIYTEVVANPSGTVADLEGLAAVAHGAGIPLVVDATVATPYLCRPIEWGADIVVHSATKFLGGHGTSLGGVVVESGRFDWAQRQLPGDDRSRSRRTAGCRGGATSASMASCTRLRAEQLRDVGPALSPFNAFLLIQGARDACRSGWTPTSPTPAVVAEFLSAHPAVSVGALGRPARPSRSRTGASATCRSVRAPCSRSASSVGARRAGVSSSRSSCAATSPTSAMCARS